jgi:acyl carrier protein
VQVDPEIEARVRSVVAEHAGLSEDAARLSGSADLFEQGMSSHASVAVMLALESEFEIEFPDEMLSKSHFGTIDSIGAAISEIAAAGSG